MGGGERDQKECGGVEKEGFVREAGGGGRKIGGRGGGGEGEVEVWERMSRMWGSEEGRVWSSGQQWREMAGADSGERNTQRQ